MASVPGKPRASCSATGGAKRRFPGASQSGEVVIRFAPVIHREGGVQARPDSVQPALCLVYSDYLHQNASPRRRWSALRDEATSSLPAVVRPMADHLPPAPSSLLCPACFWSGLPQPRLRGSPVIESLLWALGVTSMGLLLLAGQISHLSVALPCLPGLGYSVWRRSRRSGVCPQCGMRPLLPEEAMYPPACSHFLFSTEPRRAPAENRKKIVVRG